MATWHQQQANVRLWHPTQWTVVIDPPNQMRACVTFSTHELAKVYMRNLEANNPADYAHAIILRPAK